MTKLPVIPILAILFVINMGEPSMILIATLGTIPLILIVVDIFQFRKAKKTMMRPYTRFFQWIEE